ncbi:MAG TPA: hypothetical protein VJ801_11865, partial [Polyangia bacterium]|nr:hypothetical protein [Polyangia bacterium]
MLDNETRKDGNDGNGELDIDHRSRWPLAQAEDAAAGSDPTALDLSYTIALREVRILRMSVSRTAHPLR